MKTASCNYEPKRKPGGRNKREAMVPDTSAVKRAVVSVRDSTPSATAKTRAAVEAGDKEGQFYKPLPKEFRRDGFSYRQIAREKDAAVYEQTWNGSSDPGIAYEVIRIRRREGFEIADRFVAPAEVYPNSEAWGADGFTFTDKEAGIRKTARVREQTMTRPIDVTEAPWLPRFMRRQRNFRLGFSLIRAEGVVPDLERLRNEHEATSNV